MTPRWQHDWPKSSSMDTIELISGALLRRQPRLVEAWAELHQDELVANWERLQAG